MPLKGKMIKPGVYTHLKIVFGRNPKTILPEYNCNQDLVFWKTKNQTGFSINPGKIEQKEYVPWKGTRISS